VAPAHRLAEAGGRVRHLHARVDPIGDLAVMVPQSPARLVHATEDHPVRRPFFPTRDELGTTALAPMC